MRRELAFALVATVLAGCASEQVVWRKVPSETFAEISIPKTAVIGITSSKDPDAAKFAIQLREALGKVGLKVSAGDEAVTHVVLIQGGASSRADSPEEARYTGRVHVETIETDAGSFQRVKRDKGATFAASREISIAVYALKTLTPIHYLTIPIYESGDIADAANKDEAEVENRKMQEHFAKLAASSIEEIFTTRSRPVAVPIPVESNGDLKVQLLKVEAAFGANDDEALRRALAKIDSLASDTSIIPGPLEKFAEDSSAKGWKPPEGVTREWYLGNYYLIALRREMFCTDPDVLSALHAEHLRILELSENPSLRMACPVALGRLEAKLARSRAQ